MYNSSIPDHSKMTLLKPFLIFCEIFHLAGIKIYSLLTKRDLFITLIFTLKKSVTLFTLSQFYANIKQV